MIKYVKLDFKECEKSHNKNTCHEKVAWGAIIKKSQRKKVQYIYKLTRFTKDGPVF